MSDDELIEAMIKAFDGIPDSGMWTWHATMRAVLAVVREHDKDGERYRLLRRKVCIAGGGFQIINLHPTYVAPIAAVELDAVLDATIAAAKGAE